MPPPLPEHALHRTLRLGKGGQTVFLTGRQVRRLPAHIAALAHALAATRAIGHALSTRRPSTWQVQALEVAAARNPAGRVAFEQGGKRLVLTREHCRRLRSALESGVGLAPVAKGLAQTMGAGGPMHAPPMQTSTGAAPTIPYANMTLPPNSAPMGDGGLPGRIRNLVGRRAHAVPPLTG